MKTFAHDNNDADILNDLLEEINELYEASEQTLIELEIKPQDNELQRALFRSVHTIKGDLGLVGFTPLFGIMQHVEELLDMLRKDQLLYSSNLSDVVLLTLDLVKYFVSTCIKSGATQYDDVLYDNVVVQIKQITPSNSAEHEQHLTNIVHTLRGQAPVTSKPTYDQLNQDSLTKSGIPKNIEPSLKADMLFFRDMIQTVEKRVTALEGRSDRMAQMAHLVNTHAKLVIAPEQLSVACYVHDFGLAFMPQHIVSKVEKTKQEHNLLRSHVYKSARLLEHLTAWDDARRMVMQHHERIDGSGYPLGLAGDAICDGGKLIGILDTFYELHHHAIGTDDEFIAQKKALVHINKHLTHLFCPQWLGHFNQTMARVLAQH